SPRSFPAPRRWLWRSFACPRRKAGEAPDLQTLTPEPMATGRPTDRERSEVELPIPGTAGAGRPSPLFTPALHRPCEFRGRPILRPDRNILLALQLDQVRRRQCVLSCLVELHAAIADHQLIRFEIGRFQCCLDFCRVRRAGAIDGFGKHEETLHPPRAGVVQVAPILGLEQLVDDVAAAARLADVEGAPVDGTLCKLTD